MATKVGGISFPFLIQSISFLPSLPLSLTARLWPQQRLASPKPLVCQRLTAAQPHPCGSAFLTFESVITGGGASLSHVDGLVRHSLRTRSSQSPISGLGHFPWVGRLLSLPVGLALQTGGGPCDLCFLPVSFGCILSGFLTHSLGNLEIPRNLCTSLEVNYSL